MLGKLILSTSLALLAWNSLSPPFDWRSAIVCGLAAGVVSGVIIFSFVGVSLGSIGAAAMIGVSAGVAAGLFFAKQGDGAKKAATSDTTMREPTPDTKPVTAARIAPQLDIYFEPSASPNRAAEFRCTLVVYEARAESSEPWNFSIKKTRIAENSGARFYQKLRQALQEWLKREAVGDAEKQPRRVVVYMTPFPGDGVYERIRELAENNEIRKCLVVRDRGTWTPLESVRESGIPSDE